MPLWSAEFVIEDHERLPFDYAAVRIVGPHDYMVVQPWEEGSGPSSIHLDVDAETPEEAKGLATRLYEQIRREAGLAEDTPRIATLSRVAGKPFPADRLIFEAEDMFAERRFGLAVVAAQIHCEMWIRAKVAEAARASSEPLVKMAPGMTRNWSLMDRSARQIFEALTRLDPTSTACWPRYKTHVARRNAFVHRGVDISEKEARESIDTVVEMVRFVEGRDTEGKPG